MNQSCGLISVAIPVLGLIGDCICSSWDEMEETGQCLMPNKLEKKLEQLIAKEGLKAGQAFPTGLSIGIVFLNSKNYLYVSAPSANVDSYRLYASSSQSRSTLLPESSSLLIKKPNHHLFLDEIVVFFLRTRVSCNICKGRKFLMQLRFLPLRFEAFVFFWLVSSRKKSSSLVILICQ